MANNPKRGPFEEAWFIPRMGVLNNIPIYETPKNALYDALNVLIRRGTLQPRPGLGTHSNTSLLNRPMGVWVVSALGSAAFQADAFQADTFQTTGAGSNVLILVGTTRRIWVFYGGNWVDLTNTVLAGGDGNHVRFTSIEIGGTINTIITNGVDTPRLWDNQASTVSNLGGTPAPPKWTDLTTISNHIIGIIPPFTVRWGNNLDVTTGWPALNFRDVADTVDRVVAIRNLGTLGGTLYKERSIWSVLSLGGTEAGFFRFDLRYLVAGPASPAAVVEADGVHYYLTTTGRVGRWDGTSHQWVADGIWDLIKGDVDPLLMNRAFGVYNPLHAEVYFYYPRVGGLGDLKGALVVQLPRPDDGITSHIAFPLRLERPISAGADLRLESNQALVLTSDTFQSKILTDGERDSEVEFSGHWQPGLAVTPGQLPYRIEEIEVFARRGVGYGTMVVQPVVSDLLDTLGGTVGSNKTVNLSATAPVRDVTGADARGRFLGLRHTFSTPITLQWLGSRLTANPLEG